MVPTPKILVVDDEPDLQTLIEARFRKAIKNNEFEFIFAANGVEALQALEKDPDLNIILTDINMPVMDGLTLLANIPKLNRQYKAIVVSAYGDMSNIRSAMNKGASDFVIKPIDFNDFEATLRKMIDEYSKMKEAARAQALLQDLQKELDIARVIQEAMLPNSTAPFTEKGIEIAGKMLPAKEIGGDFYDYFALDHENLALFIADVSGKSISACLYMVVTKSILRALSRRKLTPIEVITQMNELLSTDNLSNMFVTGFYAVLNVRTGELAYCNAGHNPPYIISANGTTTPLNSTRSIALGVEDPPAIAYVVKNHTLSEGDSLFLYTDGITEAMNPQGDLFGESRLENILIKSGNTSCSGRVEEVIAGVKNFADGAAQSDDLTLLTVRYKSSS